MAMLLFGQTVSLQVKEVPGGDHSLHVSAKASKGQPKVDILGDVVEAAAPWCKSTVQYTGSKGAAGKQPGEPQGKPSQEKQHKQKKGGKQDVKAKGDTSQQQQPAGKAKETGKGKGKRKERQEEEPAGEEQSPKAHAAGSPKGRKQAKHQEGAGETASAGPDEGVKKGRAKSSKKTGSG
jgi:hypothetical protein